jgi:hypothetical protein
MEKDLKTLQEVIVATDAHRRLRCAIEGRPYEKPADRTKVVTLAEALRRGASVTGALVEGRRPAGIHARLAAALGGAAYQPLPAGVHQRLAEAVGARPKGIHARLARAVKGA